MSLIGKGKARKEKLLEEQRLFKERRRIAAEKEQERKIEISRIKREIYEKISSCDDPSKISKISESEGKKYYSHNGDYWNGQTTNFIEGYTFEDYVILVHIKVKTYRDDYFHRRYDQFLLFVNNEKLSTHEEWMFDSIKFKFNILK